MQAERFVSRLPLYRLQKQANEVRPYGRQNKPLQRYCAACAAAVRAKKFIQISRADNIRPYTIVLICNIETLVRGAFFFIYRNDCFTGTHIDISKLVYNVSELRPFPPQKSAPGTLGADFSLHSLNSV